MALKTSVMMPAPADVVISDIYATRIFYFGKEGSKERKIGNFVVVHWSGYGESADFNRLDPYTLGSVDFNCPARGIDESTVINQKDNDPFLLNSANDDQLRGDYVWSFHPNPWAEGNGPITDGSNFSLLWKSFADAGYCDLPGGDKSEYLSTPGTRHVALKDMFLGLQCHIVSEKKPEITSTDKRFQRKNANASQYLVDAVYGFAGDIAALANAATFAKFAPFVEKLIATGSAVPANHTLLKNLIVLSGAAFDGTSPQDVLNVLPDPGEAYESFLASHAVVVEGNIVGLK